MARARLLVHALSIGAWLVLTSFDGAAQGPPPFPDGSPKEPPFSTGAPPPFVLPIELGDGALFRAGEAPRFTASCRGALLWSLSKDVRLGPTIAGAFLNPGTDLFAGVRASARLGTLVRLDSLASVVDLWSFAETAWGLHYRQQVTLGLSADLSVAALTFRASRDVRRSETILEMLIGVEPLKFRNSEVRP